MSVSDFLYVKQPRPHGFLLLFVFAFLFSLFTYIVKRQENLGTRLIYIHFLQGS